jgi:ribosomal protein S18 acetylase RimI-like enzyme
MVLPSDSKDARILSTLINSAYRGDSSRKGWTTEADLLDGTRTDTRAIEEIIRRPDTLLLKYEENGTIRGCVELRHQNNKLYLGTLTVEPGWQGKGIGKELLKAAEREALRQKCQSIFMTVISVRHELIAWYIRHGYKDTGTRKPFEIPDSRWGIPKTKLEFVVLEKTI